MQLAPLDIIIFLSYFFGVVAFAVIVAMRSKTRGSSSDYFLASKKLPWYAVGASFIASNISTEHFIGTVGWGFLYGMAVANWDWANALTFTALIWIFLPFYMRGNVSTMPEFLARRFNSACRTIYASVMLVGLVIAMLGGVMFAGAKALNIFFPEIPMEVGILLLALTAGIYT
ncbi:MAG: sodium:solute symporter family transporter, partial [Akkermansiaceae bacterium]